MTTNQVKMAMWAPSAVMLSVAAFLGVAFIDFQKESTAKLAELDTKVTLILENVAALQARDLVTTRQMETYVDLTVLRALQKK